MKGAYIARLDLTQPHLAGVRDKVKAQVEALRALPAHVDLLHPAGATVTMNGAVLRRFGSGSAWQRLTYYFLFYVVLARRLAGLDFLYIRYQGSSPLFLWMLRRLRERNPYVAILVELPSYPYHTERVTTREKILGLLDAWSTPHLRSCVDRIVTFSREEHIFGIPTIRTDNGVDVAALDVLPRPDPGGPLRLLGLANLSLWHGYDRVIAGMAVYYGAGGQRDLRFEIVGTGSALARLQADVERAGLQDRVRFHGPRRGAELEAIIRQCHVGISSIGMHRLKVDTSNLKSREYCARGLPFVLGYEDRDFPAPLPFVFRAPFNDDPLDIAGVIAFHDRLVESHPDYPQLMRAFAEERLTWRAKMAPVVDSLRGMVRPREETVPCS